MSKRSARISAVSRILLLALIALLMLAGDVFVFVVIIFVPVVGWLVWRDQDRIAKLERRLAALEPKPEPKPEEA